jgi:hypothetical protein
MARAQTRARAASSEAVAELPLVESTHSLSERIDVEIIDGTALLAEFRARGATMGVGSTLPTALACVRAHFGHGLQSALAWNGRRRWSGR